MVTARLPMSIAAAGSKKPSLSRIGRVGTYRDAPRNIHDQSGALDASADVAVAVGVARAPETSDVQPAGRA
jgi:hypothetical protein